MSEEKSKIIVFVEIPKGSFQKYEYDEELGGIKLDRSIYGPLYFPFEYGFIKGTLGEDGDPLDCILLSHFPTFPGCLVSARLIGVLEMEDEAGVDHKLLAVPDKKIDPRMAHIENINDIPEYSKKELKEFFEVYKRLEPGKWVKVKDFKDKKSAEKLLEEAKKRYQKEK
jgi:inorganic pyrophosphatase